MITDWRYSWSRCRKRRRCHQEPTTAIATTTRDHHRHLPRSQEDPRPCRRCRWFFSHKQCALDLLNSSHHSAATSSTYDVPWLIWAHRPSCTEGLSLGFYPYRCWFGESREYMLHEFYFAVLASHRATCILFPAEQHWEQAEPCQSQEGSVGILLLSASRRGV